MTQAEKFLEFLRTQAEREICETKVLLRIEHGELVITNRCPIAQVIREDSKDPPGVASR